MLLVTSVRHRVFTTLRLALPSSQPSVLFQQLAHTPALRRRKPTRQQVVETYHDTPAQLLHQQHIVWRTEQVGDGAHTQRRQVLCIETQAGESLHHGEEWVSPIDTATPECGALLRSFPWSRTDPDVAILRTMAPRFATCAERTTWTVHLRQCSQMELVLTIGHLSASDQISPVCKLEPVLLAGDPAALVDTARRFSQTLAVLPAHTSHPVVSWSLATVPLASKSPEFWGDVRTNGYLVSDSVSTAGRDERR